MSRRLTQWRMQVRALPRVHTLLSDGQISEHHASVITRMAHHLTDDQLAGLDARRARQQRPRFAKHRQPADAGIENQHRRARCGGTVRRYSFQ